MSSSEVFIYIHFLFQKKEKQLQNGLVGKSAFSDEEDDEEKLKEIAKKFEEKYVSQAFYYWLLHFMPFL